MPVCLAAVAQAQGPEYTQLKEERGYSAFGLVPSIKTGLRLQDDGFKVALACTICQSASLQSNSLMLAAPYVQVGAARSNPGDLFRALFSLHLCQVFGSQWQTGTNGQANSAS